MSGGDDAKSRGGAAASEPQPQRAAQYGTFQGYGGGGDGGGLGVPDYSRPAIGFPQPAPLPGVAAQPPASGYPPAYAGVPYYAHGYQAVPVQGYVAVVEGRPLRMPRLPCCGIGIGWFLFIIGFFLVAIPWFVGAFILLCVRVDYREKPGLVACTIGQVSADVASLIAPAEPATTAAATNGISHTIAARSCHQDA